MLDFVSMDIDRILLIYVLYCRFMFILLLCLGESVKCWPIIRPVMSFTCSVIWSGESGLKIIWINQTCCKEAKHTFVVLIRTTRSRRRIHRLRHSWPEKVKAAKCRWFKAMERRVTGSILIWPRTAADCDDNGAVELHYAAVVWLIPDCSLSGVFTSLITFCLLWLNPDQLSSSRL